MESRRFFFRGSVVLTTRVISRVPCRCSTELFGISVVNVQVDRSLADMENHQGAVFFHAKYVDSENDFTKRSFKRH